MKKGVSQKDYVPALILIIAELALLVPSSQYFLQDDLMAWDSVGHRAEAQYIIDNGFLPFGWNNLHFFGYPLGAYPPLFHLLSAIGGGALGLDIAIKSIVVLSVLATPLSAWLLL
ncbi:MAG: hypothetical protein AB1324_03335, partial [Candidatus Micrarchaeota archaeon]